MSSENTFLSEGGRAVLGVSTIPQSAVPKTVESIYSEILKPLGLKNKGTDWNLLGSVGKKKTDSGDLDIAIDLKSLKENWMDSLKEILEEKGYEFNYMPGINVLSIAYPIYDSINLVQVDLMPTDNMDFTTWAYHSPYHTETRFKKMGTYRNAILEAIASEMAYEILEQFEDGSPKRIKKQYYSFDKGLMERIDSFVGAKGKRIKNAKVESRNCITKNVDSIIKRLLGSDATRKDTNSFESVWERTQHVAFPWKTKIESIKAKCIEIIKRKKLPIPEEIMTKEAFKESLNKPKAVSMFSIKHLDDMTHKELLELFNEPWDGSNYEISEKLDGSNLSIGVIGGDVYGKTKRGDAEFNSQYFYEQIDLNPIFEAKGRFIDYLKYNSFTQWHNRIIKEYKEDFLKFKVESVDRITIFGEILNGPQSNTICYDLTECGKFGTFVPFAVFIHIPGDDKLGRDISLSEAGQRIIKDFCETYSHPYGIKLMPKCILETKIHFNLVNKIRDFIMVNKSVLESRKKADREAKQEAKDYLSELVLKLKQEWITEINESQPMLGGDEIEGLIIRNKKNGRSTKIVDKEKFTELNSKNWAMRSAVKSEKKQLYHTLLSEVGKGADIFVLPKKQEQKIQEFLSYKRRNKFASELEMLGVLYDDIINEVQLDGPKTITKKINTIINGYISQLNELMFKTKENQLDESLAIDDINYKQTIMAIEKEVKSINKIKYYIQNADNPYPHIVKFLFGAKTMDSLRKKYLD